MKKLSKKKILIAVSFVLAVAITLSTLFSKVCFADEEFKIADSGHSVSHHSSSSHSSHSSSSSSSRSSSRSSYSSSSSSSSRGSGSDSFKSPLFWVLLLIGFSPTILIIILSAVLSSARRKSYTPYRVDDTSTVNNIKQYLPNFDRGEFLNEGYKIYLDVQDAWMNFKLDSVRNVITDEMFNMYQSQLDIMETKGEQNIMSDFKWIDSYLKGVSVQNNSIVISAVYVIEFYDYIINQNTGKVVSGNKNQKYRVTYEMKYQKSLDKAGNIDKCPNCGAKIEDNSNGAAVCKYCGSKLVFDNMNWVLTDKKVLYQRDI